MTGASTTLGDLWSRAAGEPGALDRVTLAGPVLPTDFKIGTAASAAIA
jgi:hypothetical protein